MQVLFLVELTFNDTFNTIQGVKHYLTSGESLKFRHEWMRFEKAFYANLVYAVLNVPFLLLLLPVVFQVRPPRIVLRQRHANWSLSASCLRLSRMFSMAMDCPSLALTASDHCAGHDILAAAAAPLAEA